MPKATLHNDDCLTVLASLPDNSFDAIVTDPPYGLSFMRKAWDKAVPSAEVWAECLRVAKPGAHILCFAGPRTQHRMACAVENAGWEIRDLIMWLYGSGFPKSRDVGKAIDKCNGEAGRLHKFTSWMRTTGLKASEIDRITETSMGDHYLTPASQPAIPTPALWEKLRPLCGDVPAWVDDLVARIEAERGVVGKHATDMGGFGGERIGQAGGAITVPATPQAKQWDGWGTALKPACEPITLARKRLVGTVAANVLEHGTGALNVDGCRLPDLPKTPGNVRPYEGTHASVALGDKRCTVYEFAQKPANGEGKGRWPANVVHDGSDAELHAKRYYYCAKASKADRDEGLEGFASNTQRANNHPTVKPTELMRYLCRLITPPGGIVLDPFMGSGSTGKAAVLEGFDFTGFEIDPDYFNIARARIAWALGMV